MADRRPGNNGRLALTLRVGDAARVDLPASSPSPESRSILIACESARDDASFMLTAWTGALLWRVNTTAPLIFERPERFVRMRLYERMELSDRVAVGEGLEVYVSNLEADRVTVSLDAPRDWKITRLPKHAA